MLLILIQIAGGLCMAKTFIDPKPWWPKPRKRARHKAGCVMPSQSEIDAERMRSLLDARKAAGLNPWSGEPKDEHATFTPEQLASLPTESELISDSWYILPDGTTWFHSDSAPFPADIAYRMAPVTRYVKAPVAEPKGVGAVLLDVRGDHWVRTEERARTPWRNVHRGFGASWDAIQSNNAPVEVLSEGVEL